MGRQSDNSLALVDRARGMLDRARTLDEVKDVRDVAIAAKHYASKRKGAEEAERYANEIRLRAERKLGELTAAMEKAKGAGRGQGKKVPAGNIAKGDALADAGLTRKDAHTFERLAAVPEPVFEQEVVKPDASTAKLARIGRKCKSDTSKPRTAPEFDAEGESSRLFRVITDAVNAWPSDASLWPVWAVLDQLARQVRIKCQEREESR